MDSLYGGKPGSPFVIKQAFPTIEAMVAEFAKGAGSNKVWYGEYCIIDTANKNDRTNGCIYRRGYTGPEYIGQIVGPKGGQGNFGVKSLEGVAEYLKSNLFVSEDKKINNDNYRNYPTYDNEDKLVWNWTEDGDDTFYDRGYPYAESSQYFKNQAYRSDELKDSDVAIQEFNIKDGSLVPGKDGDEYNDSIRWNYCNVRLNVDGNGNVPSELDTWMYIGFEFPYSVFNFSARGVEYWEKPNAEIAAEHYKEDGSEHPYYWPFNLDIPSGIPGNDVQNIRKEKFDATKHNANTIKLRTGQALPDTSSLSQEEKDSLYIWLYDEVIYKTVEKNKGIINSVDYVKDSNGNPITNTITRYAGTFRHSNKITKIYNEPYEPNGKHSNLKKSTTEIFPKEGHYIWIAVIQSYNGENDTGIKVTNTEYYIGACKFQQKIDNLRVEKYNKITHESVQNIPSNIIEEQYIWLYDITNFDIKNTPTTTYCAGKYVGQVNIGYSIEKSYTTNATSVTDYLNLLNTNKVPESARPTDGTNFITCTINGTVYGFVYDETAPDGKKWKDAGGVTNVLFSEDIEIKSYKNLFFTRQ